ncbi:unnamed protein product, partial [Ectocarpus sp. 12 AP-2014]
TSEREVGRKGSGDVRDWRQHSKSILVTVSTRRSHTRAYVLPNPREQTWRICKPPLLRTMKFHHH